MLLCPCFPFLLNVWLSVCREKSKYSEPYAAIEPAEIDRAGLPPPPEKDAYLKSRMEKFLLEVSWFWREGSWRLPKYVLYTLSCYTCSYEAERAPASHGT
jgi:hypothetical protein